MARKKKKKSLLKRCILFAAGLIFLLFLTLFLVGTIWIGPMAKKAVETYGPEALGAKVEVEDVSVGLFGGTAKLKGVVIHNPEGYKERIAVDAEEFIIRLRLRSLLTDTVVIENMVLKSPVISYEKHDGKNNLVKLQENAVAWAESLSDKEKDEDEPSKKVIIKRFRIEDGTLRVKLPVLPAVPVKLADIERNDIGGESDDNNFGHATRDVIATVQLNASDTVENAGDSIQKAAKDALKASKDAGKDALKAGEKVLDDAGNKIKGLFK